MSASFYAQEARTTDLPDALAYEAIRDRMRADADCYQALANAVVEDTENYGTFSAALAGLLRRGYERMAADILVAVDQADTIAKDLRAHADGSRWAS